MSTVQYQVTADCVYVTANTFTGRAKTLAYRGAFVDPDAPELKHLLDSGMVEKVGGADTTGINSVGGLGVAESDQGAAGSVVSYTPEVPAVTAEPSEADKVEAARAAAKAKLPADGSAPHANAGEAVWVEYAVSKGMERTAAESAGKDEVRKTLADQK